VQGAEAGGIALVRTGFQDGVADEIDRNAGLFKEGRLEGQQGQDAVDFRGDALHPPLPPGPDLGSDVVQDGEALGPYPCRNAQAETGAVDGDDHGGAAGLDIGYRLRQALGEATDVGQDFCQTHHRQLPHGKETDKTLLGHPVPADAGEDEVRARGA
jgi:hypothetical protein